jgi:hypothetical protein
VNAWARSAWWLFIVLSLTCVPALAQFEDDTANDDPRGNINLGMTFGSPLNPMARFSNIGWGLTAGAGYNITRRHAFLGEFMWNHLYMSSDTVNLIRAATHVPNLHAGSDLLAFTGNYRYELRGQHLGIYFIGGGGLYYRTASLSQNVTVDPGTECAAVWGLWTGSFSCSNGTFTTSQTLASRSQFAGGGNGGVGFTARVGDAPYRIYVETRYHYAPMKNVNTQLIGVSVGIRY